MIKLHVMTYRHITTKNYMTYDIKFSHVVAALILMRSWVMVEACMAAGMLTGTLLIGFD